MDSLTDPGILLASNRNHVVLFQYEEMPQIQEYFSRQIEIMLLCFSMRDTGILPASDWEHVVVFQYKEMPEIQEYFSRQIEIMLYLFQYEEMPEIQEYFSRQIEIMLLCFSMRRCQRSRNTSRVRLRSWSSRPRCLTWDPASSSPCSVSWSTRYSSTSSFRYSFQHQVQNSQIFSYEFIFCWKQTWLYYQIPKKKIQTRLCRQFWVVAINKLYTENGLFTPSVIISAATSLR